MSPSETVAECQRILDEHGDRLDWFDTSFLDSIAEQVERGTELTANQESALNRVYETLAKFDR